MSVRQKQQSYLHIMQVQDTSLPFQTTNTTDLRLKQFIVQACAVVL